MSYRVNGDALRREIFARGLSEGRFAELAQVSDVTVGHAIAGRRITPTTLQRICAALARVPALAQVEDLLAKDRLT